MFGFLNTAVLFAAAAALIPLIIHLFSRRRVKIVEFSSLKHLKAMQRRQVRRLKIRQLLLLLLRMLIILIVVLAFARPTTDRGAVGSHAAVSAVILFDNSVSMDRSVADGNLFELARKRTHQLLETFGQSDQICLIPLTAGGEESQRLLTTVAAVSEQLDRLRIGAGSADIERGLESARRLLGRSQNLNREIYIVSDRQRSSLPGNEQATPTELPVYLVDLPLEENDNIGIVSVDFGGQLIQPGLDFDLQATVRNYGADQSGDRIASLFLNGKRVAQTDFTVDAGAETKVRFTRSVSTTGFHSGWVELSEDRFAPDNRYYFAFNIPRSFNLLILGDDRSAAYFNLALVPDQTLSRFWSVKQASPDDLTGIDFSAYDVILLAGMPTLPDRYVDRLQQFVKRGKSLFAVYGANTDVEYFNRLWSDVTGVSIDQAVSPNPSRAGFYSLGSLDMTHPVFSVFGFEQNKPPEIKFFALPHIRVAGATRTIMRFSGDRPALVETRFGAGRVLTFTGPLSPEYSDMVGQAFFVPFVSRVAEYLASDLSTLDTRLFAGDQITRALPVQSPVNYPLDLIAPDSSQFSLPPEETDGLLVVKPSPTDRAGIYSISLLGQEMDRFAVNIPPPECDLTAADRDQFAAALQTEDFRELSGGADLAGVIASFRYGRELWQMFLWIAVLLVAVEMLLSRGKPSEE